MVKTSIWKDTYYTSTDSSLVYVIKDSNNAVLFTGKAYKLPSETYLKININKICRNYLSNDIQSLLESQDASATNSEACKTFYITDSNGTILETYMFLYDYDYGHSWTGAAETLSQPINGKYVDGMLKFRTTITNQGVVTNYKTSTAYPHLLSCAEYVLYYLSANGGWCSFVIEGTTLKSDKITQYTTDKTFNNQSLDFENNRYVSEIITSYKMNTGWLSDEEAANLAKNLIGSNKVYVHNLKDGNIFPAVITDTSVDYQTYKTNGKKMAQYTINIKESQSKIRR